MTKKPNQQRFETRAIHAGQSPDPLTGAIVTPIYQASTYVQDGIGENKGYVYSRPGNPTRLTVEACLADLESAETAFVFPTGLAAAATILDLLESGAHIVAHDDLYGGVYRLLADLAPLTRGHSVTFVNFADSAAVEAATREDTKMLWFETPSNPLTRIVDIEAVVAIARKVGALTVCDNTFSSPYCQRPLELGVSVVMHSATKFLNGHSDLLAGVAAVSPTAPEGVAERMKYLQNALGSVLSPVDSALLLRSLKTLAVRMDRHCENAMTIATFLSENKEEFGLDKVWYPGLEDHPGHAIAKRQMHGYGAVISLIVKGGQPRADAIMKATHLFQFAVSLGGVESLIQHPASLTHATVPEERRIETGIVDDLVRLSVGIEGVEDLLADIEAALIGTLDV